MNKRQLPRGIANNNPGNLERTTPQIQWQGLSKNQTDKRFLQFDKPLFGIRAMARNLRSYKKIGVDTIMAIVDRWAPAEDNNDVIAYSNALAKALKVTPSDRIDVTKDEVMRPLIEAIIMHENGVQPYPIELIQQAINLAK